MKKRGMGGLRETKEKRRKIKKKQRKNINRGKCTKLTEKLKDEKKIIVGKIVKISVQDENRKKTFSKTVKRMK